MEADPVLAEGWVAPELARELPGLRIDTFEVAARRVKTPRSVKERMAELADRVTGAHAVHMRQDTVPWAYRVLWRRIGIDPDVDRTPVERIVLERLKHGGLESHGLPEDAITIATLETGVPLLAFDSDRISGKVGIRPAEEGERLAEAPLPVGQIVYCDEQRPLAALTDDVPSDVGVGSATTRMTLAALTVEGVPRMSLEEAAWMTVDILRGAGSVGTVD